MRRCIYCGIAEDLSDSDIIPDALQLAVIADEKILQERLSERDVLTRFEKENQSKRELDFMEKGVRELRKGNPTTYKTNLVKCLPLTEEQKLRYPNKKEIDSCYEHLAEEIQELSPMPMKKQIL